MLVKEEVAAVTDPLVVTYMDKLTRRRVSPLTIRGHRTTGRRWDAYLQDIGLADGYKATDAQVEAFFDTLLDDYAPSTQQSHLRRVRAWYAYALARGVIQRNPTALVEVPQEPQGEPIIIENEVLRAYKEAVPDDRAWAQFHLLAFTGLRRTECIQLQWSEVNFPSSTITVLKGKGGKLRHVPMHPQLAEALKDVRHPGDGAVLKPARGARWIGDDTWTEIIRSYTGGQNTAHDFRRTVASSLSLNDVKDATIDKIMGWHTEGVGRRYYIKVAPVELQRAILKLYADDPI